MLRRASLIFTEKGGGGRDLGLRLYTDGREERLRVHGYMYEPKDIKLQSRTVMKVKHATTER